MKTVSKSNAIYSYDPNCKPAAYVKIEERVLLKMADAFGGQIRKETNTITGLDWSRIDGATGPVYIQNAEPKDTLVVEILDVKTEEKGTIVTVPQSGILGENHFSSTAKTVEIVDRYVHFENGIKIKTSPMIGTIGVTPEKGQTPTGTLGRHGGNMDVKEVTKGAKLYFPVFVEGALFAAGDMHAIQADGELCVSAIETAGQATFRFDLIKHKSPEWPVIETKKHFGVLACGQTLDEAAKYAAQTAVKALMREHDWTFEEAYMFASVAVNLKINQVVDPKKGVRAVIPKSYIDLESFLT